MQKSSTKHWQIEFNNKALWPVGCLSGRECWKSINATYHTNRIKRKRTNNNLCTLKKSISPKSTFSHNRNSQQTVEKRFYKTSYGVSTKKQKQKQNKTKPKNLSAISLHTDDRLNAFSLRSASKQGCPFSLSLFHLVLKV